MAEKYLNINCEELFQKYRIAEIAKIQKEIQYEVDKKHQELRTMVGERYRDVIEASDTIKLMQESAVDVVAGIQKIVDLCQNINSLKNELGQQDGEKLFLEQEKEQKIAQKSISMQIKILIYIPEQIWTAIDSSNFLKATQLHLLSQHIYTGLKLDTTNNVLQNYPIIKTQWMKIEHFHKRINIHLHNHLQNSTLTADVAANYLTAYALLENISVEDLLHKFVEFRKVVLAKELHNDISNHNTVKSLTCSVLKLIINTIQLIYLCFIDGGNGSGLVNEKLNNIVGKEAEPIINIVELMSDPLMKYLPKIVTEFKPILTKPIDLITPNNASNCIQIWLDWVKDSINSNLSERLNMVTSIKGLDSIREEALKIKLVDNWEILCQKLLLPRNFNVWFLIFQPLITSRVIKLIEIKWNQIVEITEKHMLESLINASSGKTAKPELDLRWFTWKEEKSDVPLKFSVDGENKFIAKGLLMKSKGYSPNVLKLCEDFDNRLGMLLNDLEVYLFGKDIQTERAIVRVDNFLSRISSGKAVNEKFSDKTEIQDHLQQISRQQMERLITNILSKSENETLTSNERMSYNLMIARFLLALQQLSPNLLKCFKRDGRINQWNDFCDYLLEKRLQTWNKWLDVMDDRLSKIITECLKPCVQSDVCSMLEFFPQWSTIEIEENNEDNTIHKSQIRIPSQANFFLQNVLFQICSKLNTIIPHTLPKQIHSELIDRLMGRILNIYEEIIMNNNTTNSMIQSQALQFLFDIKYLNIMFIVRDNTKLTSQVQTICDTLRNYVDPFDYDVFYPHLQNNVLVAAQKTQCILGVLISKPESLASVLGTKQSTTSNVSNSFTPEKDAMVLAISNCSNVWFPLLPVTAPIVSRSTKNATSNPVQSSNVKVEKKKVMKSSPKHTKPVDTSPGNLVRSGAASFLSDWFS